MEYFVAVTLIELGRFEIMNIFSLSSQQNKAESYEISYRNTEFWENTPWRIRLCGQDRIDRYAASPRRRFTPTLKSRYNYLLRQTAPPMKMYASAWKTAMTDITSWKTVQIFTIRSACYARLTAWNSKAIGSIQVHLPFLWSYWRTATSACRTLPMRGLPQRLLRTWSRSRTTPLLWSTKADTSR